MSDRSNSSAGPGNVPAAVPLVSCQLGRRIGTSVMLAVGCTAVVLAAATAIDGRPEWWAGFLAATLVALIAAAASIVVIRYSVGRPVSLLPAMTMLLSAVRLGVCLVGLIAATRLYKSPTDATGLMICGYYTVVLCVESFVIHRALSKVNAEGKIKQ